MGEGGWTRRAATLVLVVAVLGAAARLRWPSQKPALTCDPDEVHWVSSASGLVATCAPPTAAVARPPAGQALVVGQKLDLNRATAEDLAVLPGVGPHLAQALVAARST